MHRIATAAPVLFTFLILAGCATTQAPYHRGIVEGDSLVLVGTTPGNLCYGGAANGSVEVRSTYLPDLPDTVVYEEGKDYTVNYDRGTVARTENSAIPDFATNVLYGKKSFDHSEHPGYGNGPFFVFVDYKAWGAAPLVTPTPLPTMLPQTAKKLRAGGPFKIIAYGDSITAGGEASTEDLRFPNRYAAYLADKFPKANIELENGATGGDTTENGLARLEEKVLTREPDLVLLAFGMNDHNIRGVPPIRFESNLISMATQIREKTGAEVLLLSTFPPNPDWKFGSHRMKEYALATKSAADRLKAPYADVYTLWMKVLTRKDSPSLLGNNINHPNDFGHWLYLLALETVPI